MIDCGFGNLNGSLEQVQVGLFEKQICGGSKLSIFQYSMVQFWCSNVEGMIYSSTFFEGIQWSSKDLTYRSTLFKF